MRQALVSPGIISVKVKRRFRGSSPFFGIGMLEQLIIAGRAVKNTIKKSRVLRLHGCLDLIELGSDIMSSVPL